MALLVPPAARVPRPRSERWHYRQKINALVHQAIMERRAFRHGRA
jgi:hypothetical protein